MNLVTKSLMIILAITVLGAGGLFAWHFLSEEDANTQEVPGKDTLSADELLQRIVETNEIKTDLYDGGLIKVKFAVQADSPKTKEELAKRSFEMESIIIKTLSQMSKVQIKGDKGLQLVEEKIRAEINGLFGKEAVVKVYTTDRVVQ